MSFYPQPNDWTCGPFALKHALVALGVAVHEDDINRVARAHWWSGTDEFGLARAAHAFDCDLRQIRRRDPEVARKELTARLRKGYPVLLCVDEWEHWITVLRAQRSRFVIVDSKLDPVLAVVAWQKLRKRWVHWDYDYDEDDPPAQYDLLPVVPRFRPPARANFSVARVHHLRRPENRHLAEQWNTYLEDLLAICRPASPLMEGALSLGEFLRRHGELILGRVRYWHGDVTREELRRFVDNLRFVAETYGLVIPATMQRRAVADVAILASMWATALYGPAEMYGVGE